MLVGGAGRGTKRRLPRAPGCRIRAETASGAGACAAGIRSRPGMQCGRVGLRGQGEERERSGGCSSPMPGSPITRTLCGPSIVAVSPRSQTVQPSLAVPGYNLTLFTTRPRMLKTRPGPGASELEEVVERIGQVSLELMAHPEVDVPTPGAACTQPRHGTPNKVRFACAFACAFAIGGRSRSLGRRDGGAICVTWGRCRWLAGRGVGAVDACWGGTIGPLSGRKCARASVRECGVGPPIPH